MKLTNYLLVEARIEKELASIKQIEEELKSYRLYPRISAASVGGFSLNDPAVCRIIGSALHDIYTAVENIFETIAERLDGSLPVRAEWHKELLEQMLLEIPGVRIAVLKSGTVKRLHELRGFRHRFRNVYGYLLDFDKLKELLVLLPVVLRELKTDLNRFCKKMRELYDLPAE